MLWTDSLVQIKFRFMLWNAGENYKNYVLAVGKIEIQLKIQVLCVDVCADGRMHNDN